MLTPNFIVDSDIADLVIIVYNVIEYIGINFGCIVFSNCILMTMY